MNLKIVTWEARLSGDPQSLQTLANYFKLPELRIYYSEQDKNYFLASKSFDDYVNPKDADDRAIELLDNIKISISINNIDNLQKVSINTIHPIYEDGSRGSGTAYVQAHFTCHLSMSVNAVIVSINGESIPNDTTQLAMYLSKSKDENVKAVIRLLKRIKLNYEKPEEEFFDLYKIFERIRKDLGGGKTAKRKIINFGFSEKEISNFTETASYHRHEVTEAKEVITLKEGKDFIRNLLFKYLQYKNSQT